MKSLVTPRKKKHFNVAIFLMAMCGVIFLILFNYLPMFGVVIAFKDMDGVLSIIKALFEKPCVGFKNFGLFLKDRAFLDIMWNTLGLNVVQLIFGFPMPILLALLLNEVRHLPFKKTIQTITYFPYFISWVVYGGILIGILSPDGGVLNSALINFGIIKEPISFLSDPSNFWTIATISGILKGMGWGTVIYLAAIAGIDPSIYEAATIDGANRFQQMRYITLPSIVGTVTVFLLLQISGLLNSSFDQIYILQNPLNISRSEVIDTYVYKLGITQMRYSYTTAVGLFKSFISLALLSGSQILSKRVFGRGLY